MDFFRRRDIFIMPIAAVILIAGVFFAFYARNYFVRQPAVVLDSLATATADSNVPLLPPPPQKLSNPPEIIKAVYVTGYSAGTQRYLAYLTNLFKTTEINAVVIDIKDYSGLVSYKSGAIKDIDSLVRFFHDQNVYVIGRIVVFEDPAYAKARPDLAIYNRNKPETLWKDNNGLSWLDPASKDVWDYNISLAKDVFYHGFDEVNFDYVRFPSDGNVGNMGFPVWDEKAPKAQIIKGFFSYLRAGLANEKISVDLFGQTTTNTDDMGIGQVIENAFENFDYVSPMVYPSHYINGFMGFANPAEHPYEIVNYSMSTALAREKVKTALLPVAKLRPWLQDFNMGADYTADMVKQEIKAVEDSLASEYNGFMLWNPSNIYNAY